MQLVCELPDPGTRFNSSTLETARYMLVLLVLQLIR